MIDKLVAAEQNNGNTIIDDDIKIVAIDGRCASGKSTLAEMLKKRYDCNVFRTDDFFLPHDKKTKERLSKPGGNCDYERFKKEVLENIMLKKAFSYNIYDCGSGKYRESGLTGYKKLNIVEGSYCLHESLIQYYDAKIVLDVEPVEQIERLSRRESADSLERFKKIWIPLEEKYIREWEIFDKADVVVKT